jgi:hypothetical protein
MSLLMISVTMKRSSRVQLPGGGVSGERKLGLPASESAIEVRAEADDEPSLKRKISAAQARIKPTSPLQR